MAEKENKNKITVDTPIQFSMGKLAYLLGGMLILFFGFYSLVVAPRLNSHDKLIEENRNNQTEQYKEINTQLMEMNNGIGTLNGTVAGFGERFNDLRGLRDSNENTSGGFDSN